MKASNTGVIIQARMGSTRLPGKVLMKINNKETLLEYMINRVKKCKLVDKIVVATSTEKRDDKIEDLCKSINVDVFRGSESDVLKRYVDCAVGHRFNTIVRLTADCPLVDPSVIDLCVSVFENNDFDYVANTCPIEKSMFPDGVDVEVFSYNSLYRANIYATDASDREHVTHFMWKYDNGFKTHTVKNERGNESGYRFTVDYPEDLKVVKFIISEFQKYKSSDLSTIISIFSEHPDLKKLNSQYM